MALKVELGRKYSAADAKAVVDKLYLVVRERWEVKVNQTPFMQQLMAGQLPVKVLQMFFRNSRPIVPAIRSFIMRAEKFPAKDIY